MPRNAKALAGFDSDGERKVLRETKGTPAFTEIADLTQPPRVVRAVAPPLPLGNGTVNTILKLVVLHLRRTVPAVSDLTFDEFDEALADLRPQLEQVIDEHTEGAIENDRLVREIDNT